MNNAYRKKLINNDQLLSSELQSRGTKKGNWPNNAKHFFTQDSMKHEDAYDKAIQLIMQHAEHNICEITWWFRWGYTLKCWTASDTTPTTFGSGGGNNVLFFSETLFKWKDFEDESKLILTTLN